MKTKILWVIFFLLLLVAVISLLDGSFKPPFLDASILYLPVLLLLLHSIWTSTFLRGITLIFIACFTGFIFEFIGLKYGTFFGGDYVYGLQGAKILTVPLIVILYWGVFIYTGYCITNSFLYWLDKNKPAHNKKDKFLLPLLILFDGFIVVAIDLFMDPLQVKAGSWTWIDKGPYFGVPIGNFVGWFLVTIIATGLFRIYEYFKPREFDKKLKSVFVIPILGYGLVYLSFLGSAIRFEMIDLALTGSLGMVSVIALNITLLIGSIRAKGKL